MTDPNTVSVRTPRSWLASSALLLALGSVALSAVAATPPYGLPDRGVLRLQLGTTDGPGDTPETSHEPRRWIHELGGLPGMEQTIGNAGKCGYTTSGDRLAVLTATGGLAEVGLGPDSIGVANGPKGVACYRISYNVGEALKFGLGPDLLDGTKADANTFYRLELDIETKSNAEFVLEILQGNSVTATYRLRSGSSVRAGEGSATPPYEDNIYNCSASSDSGPDSGPNDNCRFIVDELGQSFRLTPWAGEGSLEGGGDYGSSAYGFNTLIYLTKAEIGALGCENSSVPESTNTNTIGDGINDARCSVTRIDPTGLGGSCTIAIGYLFRNIGDAAEGCELVKSPGEQLAASISITFPPEASTALGAEPKTEIEFSNGAGGFVPFTPERCVGTVVLDRNGNPTIAEVLTSGAYPDVVAGGQKDWACILRSDVEYLGPASNRKMQVSQTILFWGDIRFSRD